MFALRPPTGAGHTVRRLDIVTLGAPVIVVIDMGIVGLLGMEGGYFSHKRPPCRLPLYYQRVALRKTQGSEAVKAVTKSDQVDPCFVLHSQHDLPIACSLSIVEGQ